MKTEETDVIVVGGGVIGSSITYHLAKDGVNVIQLEKGGICNQGSASRASAGGIRLNNRDTREIHLAHASISRWRFLEEELEADLEYRETGQIMLFDKSYGDREISHLASVDKKNNIRGRIVKQEELKKLFPLLSANYPYGILYMDGGHANPLLTTIGFSSAARRMGANIRTGSEVQSIKIQNNRVIGVNTNNGFIASSVVINAAGAWADKLHQSIGSTLPIKPRCHQMSATYSAPNILPGPVIGAKNKKISLKQTVDGRIRAGGGYPAKPGPDEFTGTFNKESLLEQRKTVISIFPELRDTEVDFTYYGAEGYCKDHVPILGKVPNIEGYLLATGFSGHGFTLSPGVGQVLSDMAQNKTPSISIDELSIDRSYETKNSSKESIKNMPG
ncbi:FAD-binding oxidoreductase [Bacillus sp. H-16]|uniref:NAD(P)/FAD-dependent oxidoreductase n=1 Tax=Alteribacter salitolerans TaxID=2912333 RepID=UPI00196234BE|nr:FAD-binding oxidoreductase [Alteribacter salitolerans]MBM7095174.1 FAD-binding oxidoreductase [Alteribacter salitolerans]